MLSQLLSRAADLTLYILFLSAQWTVKVLPRTAALSFGAVLGRTGLHFARRDAKRARENLQLAFPELSESQIDEQHRLVFENIGKTAIEILQAGYWTDEKMLRHFSIRGQENLDRAASRGRGVILITGHIGFWEAIAPLLPTLGHKNISAVAKPVKNRYINGLIARQRQERGTLVIDHYRAAGKILRALNQKRIVAILMDQRTTPEEGVAVDFFGRQAYTTPIIAKIAAKQQIPVVPCVAFRTPNNTYEVLFEPPILLDEEKSAEKLIENTALLTGHIENAIRSHIPQWCWNYRRWTTKNRTRQQQASEHQLYGSAEPDRDKRP